MEEQTKKKGKDVVVEIVNSHPGQMTLKEVYEAAANAGFSNKDSVRGWLVFVTKKGLIKRVDVGIYSKI